MPELPEVELTRRRLEPDLTGKRIERVEVRVPKLRLPIPEELATILPGRTIRSVARRGKYLLLDCEAGWLIIHLGMTGFLRFLPEATPPGKHDHLDIHFYGGSALRFHDPRKFGTVAWTTDAPVRHPLLAGIGPEPLTFAFDGDYLFQVSRSRRVAVKQFIMNGATVAGVGNIYANEALFRAAIRPDRHASSLSLPECERLALAIREVLQESIDQGSTYRVAEDSVAYHPLEFTVYGRGKGSCTHCNGALEEIRLGNRSTVFCPRCQQ
ncbi:bifunctional DNA-formamidopyrimidine glycosylase/DNA-(apurinic or apyrimidinic site) lyase [Oryzomonas japonica]|uniref:Formamidopyrimidine-DNA glycosylase n=1 Tax=Oryzomonas japonica TaxID=2603858 RepID=A0A7J4ZQ16_9BACT|nr:bifunctional DNA-formamidopyrimidine glycosylase/DNA-(apurinic or apyrimidinic site) lyase [Oryzomonas japonica]KAB0665040.1 bifunctional DNA-formamidopyrimidine glycosylase/DNA-(apurinic or apyrimidinic site) lyase [Oryzomonas japonica]